MGHPDPWPKTFEARFEGECRKKAGRLEFLRGTLSRQGTTNVAKEAGQQGSHQLAALAEANCIIHFPLEAEELRNGDTVAVTELRWGIW